MDCKNIKFTIDIKNPVTISCEFLSIIKKPRLKRLIKPFIENIPHPHQWIEWFAENGINVAWRYHHSEAIIIDNVPKKNYGGWFIQEIDKIPQTTTGLFFSLCKTNKDGFFLLIERYEFSKRSWSYLQRILCKFKDFNLHSVDFILNATEWKSIVLKSSITI